MPIACTEPSAGCKKADFRQAALKALCKTHSFGRYQGFRTCILLMLVAGRKKADFRRAALEALQNTLAAFPGQDHFAAAAPLLLAALAAHADAQAALLAGGTLLVQAVLAHS